MNEKVEWDRVPDAVRLDLASRKAKLGDTAISDAVRGERWYFRRVEHGWKNLAVDRKAGAPTVAPDLTPEEKIVAARQMAVIEQALVGAVREKAQAASAAPYDEMSRDFSEKLLESASETLQDIYYAKELLEKRCSLKYTIETSYGTKPYPTFRWILRDDPS